LSAQWALRTVALGRTGGMHWWHSGAAAHCVAQDCQPCAQWRWGALMACSGGTVALRRTVWHSIVSPVALRTVALGRAGGMQWWHSGAAAHCVVQDCQPSGALGCDAGAKKRCTVVPSPFISILMLSFDFGYGCLGMYFLSPHGRTRFLRLCSLGVRFFTFPIFGPYLDPYPDSYPGPIPLTNTPDSAAWGCDFLHFLFHARVEYATPDIYI
jgi:hypothetical protein